MAAAAAASAASPPTLAWHQGSTSGAIPLTKASGVRAALKSAGAIVSEDITVTCSSSGALAR